MALTVTNLLLVGFGGAVGSMLRFVLQSFIGFPWSLPLINGVGAFLIGYAMQYTELSPAMRICLVTGVLGGFTTMSGYAYEMQTLLLSEKFVTAGIYWSVSTILTVVLCYVGYRMALA